MKLKGTVKGHAIELDEPTGLPEGQRVDVFVWADILPVNRTPEELAAAQAEYQARRNTPAYSTFNPRPPGKYVVTNEIVDRIRDEMGI